ncbi:MAG: hypothetical protein M0P73_15710 [Syntrophobacterales bacterium]|jgi:hypothetical protein|nr:hypothetical protein [Syntrophobacterales bacterium]
MFKRTKFVSLISLLSLLFGLLLLGSAEAKKKQVDQVTASAGVLAALSQKGLIQVCPGDISTFILVEPLWWRTLSHAKKVTLVNAAITVAQTEKKRPDFIIIQDMTARETLARGFVDKGTVEVFK